MNLTDYGNDLTSLAKAGSLESFVERTKEIQRIGKILTSRGPRNVLITGPPGCGKTALVENLAQWLAASPNASLNQLRLFQLDLMSMVAGTQYRGQLEERYTSLLRALRADRNMVLVIDEAHQISHTFSSEGTSLADVLKPALARGDVTMIAISTIEAWNGGPGRDSAIDRRFTRVELGEMTADDTFQVLKHALPTIAGPAASAVNDEILEYMIEASKEILDRALPDRALRVLREVVAGMGVPACSLDATSLDPVLALLGEEIRLLERGEYDRARGLIMDYRRIRSTVFCCAVSREDVQAAIARLTGAPPWEQMRQAVAELEDALKERIIGQRHAVSAVCKALGRAVVGFKQNLRPIGSFLFIGPTGVGKTEVCRGIADLLFEGHLIRIDSSEYSEEHSISKLIGAPPGYIGHEEGGILTTAVSEAPFSLVVFDEFEKAHPKVHKLLLQLLEEGCLTDGRGKRISFSRTVVVLTSNYGSSQLLGVSPDDWNESYDNIRAGMMSALMQEFSPELINRLDDVVLFTPLSEQDCEQILDILLASCLELICAEHDIKVEVSPEARAHILSEGYDPLLGARPLRRAINAHIVDPISEAILDGRISDSDSVTFMSSGKGGVRIDVIS